MGASIRLGRRRSSRRSSNRACFSSEPLYVDMRWATPELLDLKEPRFRASVLSLAAPIRGVDKAELDSADVREQRRLQRYRTGAIATLSVLFVIAVVLGVLTYVARRDAVAQRDRALVAEDDAVAQRDRALVAEDDAVAQRDRALVAEDDAVAQRDRALEAEALEAAARTRPRLELERGRSRRTTLPLPSSSLLKPSSGPSLRSSRRVMSMHARSSDWVAQVLLVHRTSRLLQRDCSELCRVSGRRTGCLSRAGTLSAMS